MQSIPNNDAVELYGLSWKRIFKLRNTAAWRWYDRFGSRIPVEEFMSVGNQVIAECLNTFEPDGPSSFAHFLYRALDMRMPDVARREWAGMIQRTYAGTGRHRHVTSTTYQGPTFTELPVDPTLHDDGALVDVVPPALLAHGTQELYVHVREALRFVEEHAHPKERLYLAHVLAGDDYADIGRRYGVTKEAARNRLCALRERLRTWFEEVSYAAAE